MALKSQLMAAGIPGVLANMLGLDPLAVVSAAGSSQTNATALVANNSNVTTVGAGQGVIIARSTDINAVINNGANPLKIYPPVGHAFNGQSANAAVTIQVGSGAILIPAGSNWAVVDSTTGSSGTLGATTINAANANALAVGPNGTTNPTLQINTATASAATGLSITSAAAGAGVAETVVSSGTNENWTQDAKGSGTITLNGTATGAVVVGHGLNVTGVQTNTSASATAFGVGATGATNPAFNIDASTASSATGLNIKSAAAGAGLALSVISSGTPENLTIDAKGTGTITLNGTATGVVNINHGLTVAGATTTLTTGTATIAPLTFAAGTNLTTAAAGAMEFDGTVFYATAVASARQQIDAEQFTIATNNSATYNNTGLDTASAAPVFTTTMGGSTNGAITLVAGKTYAFEANYLLTNTGTTSHTWSTLFGGTATLTSIAYSIFGLSATGSAPATGGLTGYATVATAVVATAAQTSATENVTIQLNGVLTVNAGGTFIPQMQASARPGASGTPGVIVLKGSYFRIWELAGTGTLGNWS